MTVGTSLTAPPTGFVDDGKPAGFQPDLLTAIAEQMCLEVEFVDLTFQGLFPGLVAKRFDLVAANVGITEERKQSFDFVPVFKGGLRLIAKKDSGLFFETEKDVCGHPTAVVSGSTQMAALEKVQGECPADKPMVLRTFSNMIEAANEVAKGAVEAAFIDWPIAANLVQQRPDDYIEASPVISGKGPGTPRNRNGLVIRKGEQATFDAVAGAFAAVLASGAYDEMLTKWNLADGDIRVEGD